MDDPIPEDQRRPWIIELMGQLDRVVLALFLAVFVYMIVLWMAT